MKKLILKNGLSPGDIVMLTAAVRDLHRCYPNQFLCDVRTHCQQLWDNNPYISPLDEREGDVTVLDCDYPLIARSNQAPYHCLHGFIQFLNDRLGINIRPTEFKGDIHISEVEKSWYSQVEELTGEDTPFWILVAGGKFDVTIKWWETQRYQQVVDYFKGKIQFVQVGEQGHHHPKLNGVIDLRGKTDLRQFIRLIYHSQGVLCGVTAAMHLAAAVETKTATLPNRPCVVIAGGREPVHWEAYPQHQFIHTVGQLPCCAHGGCWKARTIPLGDGDERDNPGRLCVDVVKNLPRCMDMITAAEVIQRIENYFRGGALQYLTPHQSAAAEKAVALTAANPFESGKPRIHPVPAVTRQTLLIQQGSGVYAQMLEVSSERHSAYAARQGFTYWCVKGDIQWERHPAWNKVLLIQMGLALGFDLIIWLDADTLILDLEADLRAALPGDKSIGMCRHPLPLGGEQWHYNSGVIFARNTSVARSFFERVWHAGPVDHPWQEQVRINEISRIESGLVHQVDDTWNSTAAANPVENPVIRAWHGQGEKAIRSMRETLDSPDPERNTTPSKRQKNGAYRDIPGRGQAVLTAASDPRP